MVHAHSQHPKWQEYSCKVLATCADGSRLTKLAVAVFALLKAPGALRTADIVHIHASGGTSLLRKSIFFACAKLMGKKVIVHLHAGNIDWLFGNFLVRSVARMVLGSADRVIVLSPKWMELIHARCPQVRLAVVPNPVSGTATNSASSDSQTVLFLGRLDAAKGYRDLIAAMGTVVERFPHARLVLAGNGEVERARHLATEFGISNNVELPGWIEQDQKAQLLAESAILCLPSYAEGMPMAVLEGMQAGLPVVCTAVGGLTDLIRDGENGLFVEAGNIPNIAGVIGSLLADPETRRRLGTCAREVVMRSYNLDSIWPRISAIYDELLGPGTIRTVVSGSKVPHPSRR
jgi:glycosyltransferase involved in cell wall biosynthesis